MFRVLLIPVLALVTSLALGALVMLLFVLADDWRASRRASDDQTPAWQLRARAAWHIFAGVLLVALSMALIVTALNGRSLGTDTLLGVLAHGALAIGLVAVSLLPCDLFPNGYRYASESWRRAQRRPPLAVHNNWIKGHAAKLARFKEWGLWREYSSPS